MVDIKAQRTTERTVSEEHTVDLDGSHVADLIRDAVWASIPDSRGKRLTVEFAGGYDYLEGATVTWTETSSEVENNG